MAAISHSHRFRTAWFIALALIFVLAMCSPSAGTIATSTCPFG